MVRLGQHFLADANLLAAIVRDAELEGDEVVLEVGGGEGALSRALAPRARALHVIELDGRLREPLGAVAAEHPNVSIHFGDAMRLDLGGLDPAPTAVVSNLPYSIATPLILRTIAELPALDLREIGVAHRAGVMLEVPVDEPEDGHPQVGAVVVPARRDVLGHVPLRPEQGVRPPQPVDDGGDH